MANPQSQKVAKRLTAAERVRAALAAQQAAMTAGVDAAMKAHEDHEAALATVAEADDRLRGAVEALVQTGQSLEEIAALTDVPLSKVRASRRPKRDGDDEPASSPASAGRSARESAERTSASVARARVGDPVPGTKGSTYGALDPAVTGTAAPASSGDQREPAA